MNLEDFCEILHLDYTSEDSDTVGGYLLELLEHFPKAGEKLVTPEGVTFQILTMDKMRIDQVRVIMPAAKE